MVETAAKRDIRTLKLEELKEFFLQNGEKPFRGNSYHELLQAMTSGKSLPELDRGSREFFEKSLALEPAARFTTPGEMKRVLSMSDFTIQ